MASAERVDTTWTSLLAELQPLFAQARPFPESDSHLLMLQAGAHGAPAGDWRYALLADAASLQVAASDGVRLWLSPPSGALRPGEGAAVLRALQTVLSERSGLSSGPGPLPGDPPATLASTAPPALDAAGLPADLASPTPLVLRVRCTLATIAAVSAQVLEALPALVQPSSVVTPPPDAPALPSPLSDLRTPETPERVSELRPGSPLAPPDSAPLLEDLGRPTPPRRSFAAAAAPSAPTESLPRPRARSEPTPAQRPLRAPGAVPPHGRPASGRRPTPPASGPRTSSSFTRRAVPPAATDPRRLAELRRARSLGLPPPPAWPSSLEPARPEPAAPEGSLAAAPVGELLVDWPDQPERPRVNDDTLEGPLDESKPVDLVLLSRGPFPTRVKRVLTILLSTDLRDAERLLAEAPTVLLASAEVSVARRYAQALRQAGARLRIEQRASAGGG